MEIFPNLKDKIDEIPGDTDTIPYHAPFLVDSEDPEKGMNEALKNTKFKDFNSLYDGRMSRDVSFKRGQQR